MLAPTRPCWWPANVILMLAQRRRRCANIEITLVQRLLCAGMYLASPPVIPGLLRCTGIIPAPLFLSVCSGLSYRESTIQKEVRMSAGDTGNKPVLRRSYVQDLNTRNGSEAAVSIQTQKHLYNICTMLDQRRRRWADVVKLLYKCFAFAGMLLSLCATLGISYRMTKNPKVLGMTRYIKIWRES